MKRIGGKTFYLIEGVWTDSELKEDANLPETAITFGSEEYFALLKQTIRSWRIICRSANASWSSSKDASIASTPQRHNGVLHLCISVSRQFDI